MLVCVYVGVCVCRCVCVGVCVYVLVGVQQCVCVCQCVRAPISLPAFGRVCAVACLGKSLSPVVLLLLPFHFLLPIHTLLPPRSHTRSLTHALSHTRSHTRSLSHTHAQTLSFRSPIIGLSSNLLDCSRSPCTHCYHRPSPLFHSQWPRMAFRATASLQGWLTCTRKPWTRWDLAGSKCWS